MTENEVTRWLSDHAIVLDGVEFGVPPDDLVPWGRAVSGARVIGLAEAVGGSRGIAGLVHRLLHYLVVERGVRTLALEASESATVLLDAHIADGTGSVGQILESLGGWDWRTREVLTLVSWLQEHNREVPAADRVRVVGIDPARPAAAVRGVGVLLRTAAPAQLDRRAEILADLVGVSADGSRAVDARGVVREIIELLDRDAPALIAATSAAQHAEARRQAASLARTAEFAAGGTLRERLAVRERLMAEAVRDATVATGPATVVWAHADRLCVRDQDGPSMGALLREWYGDEYYALLLTCGAGSVQALRRRRLLGPTRTPTVHRLRPAPAGSVEETLAAASEHDYLVDLRGLRAASSAEGAEAATTDEAVEAATTWGAGLRSRRSVGQELSRSAAATVPFTPLAEVDGIGYIRETRPIMAR